MALALGSVPLAMNHMSHSIWHDEAQSHFFASQSTLGKVTTQTLTVRPYPPLFFFALHYSLRLRDDEMGLRLPSALFGALSIIAVFLLGATLVDCPTGTIAAFLFVLTPGAFRYFVDGDAYTLVMLASALSTIYLWKAAHSNATGHWVAYAAFALLGLGTHTLFLFLVGGQLLAGVFLVATARPVAQRSFKRLAAVGGLLASVTLVWTLYYVHAGGDSRPITFSTVPEFSTVVSMAGMLAGPQSFYGLAQILLWGALLALGAAALYRDSRREFWSIAIMIGAPVVTVTLFIKLTLPFVAYRYSLMTFPLTCVVAACCWKLWPRRRLARVVAAALILAYCGAGAAFIVSAGVNTFGYQDWRSAVRYLAERFTAGDLVLVTGDTPLAFAYYWKGPEPLRSTSSPQEISAALAQALATRDAITSRAWVLLSNYANESLLVGRYTESMRRGEVWERDVAQAMESRSLHICETAAFQRVTVLEVRLSSCQQSLNNAPPMPPK
jgi:4-amino-4-deoxy-L-arabinose transferase-like glycosyltransferase